ncbi:hypothetical protein D3C76_528280 [compost metagenome]
MSKLIDADRWAPLIGNLIIAFGYIESITHDCLRKWTTPTTYKHIKSMPLSQRLDFTIDLLREQNISESIKRSFIEDLLQIHKITKIRNTVAHSPLLLEIIGDETDSLREVICHNTNAHRSIEFDQLASASTEAIAIVDRFYDYLAAIRLANLEFSIPREWNGLGR